MSDEVSLGVLTEIKSHYFNICDDFLSSGQGPMQFWKFVDAFLPILVGTWGSSMGTETATAAAAPAPKNCTMTHLLLPPPPSSPIRGARGLTGARSHGGDHGHDELL